MAKFCKQDGVTGVDVVLNSLSHDEYIPRTLKYLKKNGRFMEIGKRNVYTKEQMTKERPDVYYELLALDYYMAYDQPKFNELLTRLTPEVAKGWWKPVPVTTFEGLEKGPDAFRFLQRAQQIGKVVITIPSRMGLKPDATYVLSGGMGSIGLLTARTMIEEGAKNVVLLSRSGKPASDAVEQWEWLQTASAKVVSKRCDVANAQATRNVLREIAQEGMAPVKGAMHLAAVLDDATLPKLTRKHFENSFSAKVEGARSLHDALEMSALDFYVLFSSTSALIGSPGQGNYSAANSTLDALAHYWQQQGEKVWSVQWGPWKEAGMAAQKGTVERLRSQGVGSLTNAFGMSMLSSVLGSGSSMLVAQPIRWKVYLKQFPRLPVFLAKFGADAKSSAAAKTTNEDAGWNLERVTGLVRETAMEVIGNSNLKDDTPLMEAGMDSLSAVEFRNRIAGILPDVKLSNTLIFDYPNIGAISGNILEQLGPVGEAAPAAAAAAPAAPLATNDPLAILGMACRFPAGATSPERFWDRLVAKKNAMQEIPFSRWDVNEFYAEEIGTVGKMYARKGAFIDDGDLFDAAFFGISGAEAKAMDPQQRVLLEASFDAFHRAGYTK
jgi:NAD(P)-dependent dehydrogenase (short-subunit alcohol dehydrogenase family)